MGWKIGGMIEMKHNIGTRQKGIGGKISIIEYERLKSINKELLEVLKEISTTWGPSKDASVSEALVYSQNLAKAALLRAGEE